MTRKTVILINVQSRSACYVLLERICSYPESVLRHKSLIFDTCDIYVSKDVGIRCHLSKPQGARKQKDRGTVHYREIIAVCQ
jgi:hypothetical protein